MKSRFSLLIFIAIYSVSCSDSGNPVNNYIDYNLLTNYWVHSIEEQANPNDQILIFRPQGYKDFPISWFRETYQLFPGGSCNYLVLHPADAHYMEEGTWTFVNQDKLVIQIKDPLGNTQIKFQVLSLSKNKLTISHIP